MAEPPASLAGKTALVTGASKGIGRAISLALAEAGAQVAIAARGRDDLREVAAQMVGDPLVLSLDVTDEAACRQAVSATEEAFGQLDILVNNAGIAKSSKFTDIDTASWQEHLAVDLNGPFWLTQAAVPGMLARGSGVVLSVGSVASKAGLAYAVHYTAAKHALLGMTRALAVEYARSGVRFNCLCPGYVATPMTEATIENIIVKTGRTREQALEPLLTPQGTLIDPADVASMCVFLASDAAKSITGQAIQIDGGLLQS